MPKADKYMLKYQNYTNKYASQLLELTLKELIEENTEETRQLLKELSEVTRNGEMPSFQSEGARTGYMNKRFVIRSSYVGLCLLHPDSFNVLIHLCGLKELKIAR